jgi:hypothetical protein
VLEVVHKADVEEEQEGEKPDKRKMVNQPVTGKEFPVKDAMNGAAFFLFPGTRCAIRARLRFCFPEGINTCV